MPDLGGLTLLYIAAFLDHEQACEWLLQQGATVYPQEEVEDLYHNAVFYCCQLLHRLNPLHYIGHHRVIVSVY